MYLTKPRLRSDFSRAYIRDVPNVFFLKLGLKMHTCVRKTYMDGEILHTSNVNAFNHEAYVKGTCNIELKCWMMHLVSVQSSDNYKSRFPIQL